MVFAVDGVGDGPAHPLVGERRLVGHRPHQEDAVVLVGDRPVVVGRVLGADRDGELRLAGLDHAGAHRRFGAVDVGHILHVGDFAPVAVEARQLDRLALYALDEL